MGNLSYNNYTGQLVFRYPLPSTQYNNPYGYYGLSYYGQCCCCCADLCYGYSWLGKYACCCGLPNPTTGRTDLEVEYNGTQTYSFTLSCDDDYSNGCQCYDYVWTSEISTDVPDNPCCVTITIRQEGWQRNFYPFSIECCCECEPDEVDYSYDISYCCPEQDCPEDYTTTYRYCCCCDGTVYSPIQTAIDVYNIIDTKTCYEHNYEEHQDYTFNNDYCSFCGGNITYDKVITITYSYTIYDPDNCCRFCIPPLERYDDESPYGLVSKDYWGPANVSMSCGTWPCLDEDGGIACTPDSENVSDCTTYCTGTDCGGS